MADIFNLTTRPAAKLFERRGNENDARLGEIVSRQIGDYDAAQIVILGCPQDAGVIRSNGRGGAKLAPDAIRREFYKLTNFNINALIFDLGNTIIKDELEATHDTQQQIVEELLRDDKKIISLGGGGDIAYPDARAMAKVFGTDNIIAFNINQHFDARLSETRNNETAYRQLLDENLLEPANFYEVAFQTHSNSRHYFDYLQRLNVNLISLEEFRQIEDYNLAVLGLRNERQLFWCFDADAVRASDAPGTSAPSPLGLLADEFCDLAAIAGFQAKTRVVEFTEVNPKFDIDNRTAKLIAIAMHRFCAAVSTQ